MKYVLLILSLVNVAFALYCLLNNGDPWLISLTSFAGGFCGFATINVFIEDIMQG